MTVNQIISSGVSGAESAALDVAIRFNVPYGGYSSQGSLIAGDRLPGRYRLDERPFVNPMVLMKANLERSDGLLVFSLGPVPRSMIHLMPFVEEQNHPCLHIDFAECRPEQAAFQIDTWVTSDQISRLFISGSSILEDKLIYQRVNDALTCFFMLGIDTAGSSQSRH